MDIPTASKKKGGFTLVEMIVTITIIVILLSAIVISLIGYIEKTKRATRIARCHDCVLAAQALVLENYANDKINVTNGRLNTGVTGPDVAARAQVSPDEGSVSSIEFDSNLTLIRLVYKASNGEPVTYTRDTSGSGDSAPEYIFSDVDEWSSGKKYTVGDIMETNGYRFRCIRDHVSGTSSTTRNPTVGSNKLCWEAIGYTGEILSYFYILRYAEGVSVISNGNLYTRTDYIPTGGQTPSRTGSTDYWILVGPAP